MDLAAVDYAPVGRRWLYLFILALVPFMAVLDANIVNVAMPVMCRSLSCSMRDIQWVATVYIIVVVAVILIFGKLGDGVAGKKALFIFGVGLFTLGSLLCGTSVSLPMLILARALQALGGAAAQSINQALATLYFPPTERGRAMGILGMSVAVGAALGTPLGGLIVSHFSWHFIFLINVPFGVMAFFMSVKFLPGERGPDAGPADAAGPAPRPRFDFAGALLQMIAFSGIFLAMNLGIGQGYNLPVLSTLLAGALFLAAFVIVERRAASPILDFGIFKNKMFSLSLLCAFVAFASTNAILIIHPFYLQDVLKLGPGAAGWVMMAFPLVAMVTAPISGYASDKLGSGRLTLIGLCILSAGLFLISLLDQGSRIWVVCLFIAIVSFGNAVFNSPNTSLVMSSVPRGSLGVAGSLTALTRNLGIISGITVFTTVFYASMSRDIGYKVGGYVQGRDDVFIYGMRFAYHAAMVLCLFGAAMTAYRLIKGKKLSGGPEV